MEDNRRGFLKTLGKLGVALGITTAACSSKHHHHSPHHPQAKTRTTTFGPTPNVPNGRYGGANPPSKAKPRPAPKVKNTLKGYPGTTASEQAAEKWQYGFTGFKKAPVEGQIKFAGNVTVTNRKAMSGEIDDAVKATAEAQRTIDAVQNMRLDNARMAMNPDLVVPQSGYDYMQRRQAVRDLDPYNWGKVFMLTWHDWRSDDPSFATQTGWWTATVRPQFRGVFEDEVYCQSQRLSMEYIVKRVGGRAETVADYAKEECYRGLVNKLQDVILERIKRDVKSST